MKFVETPIFTKAVKAAFADDEYRMLQTVLLLRPEQGPESFPNGGLGRFGGPERDMASAADIV